MFQLSYSVCPTYLATTPWPAWICRAYSISLCFNWPSTSWEKWVYHVCVTKICCSSDYLTSACVLYTITIGPILTFEGSLEIITGVIIFSNIKFKGYLEIIIFLFLPCFQLFFNFYIHLSTLKGGGVILISNLTIFGQKWYPKIDWLT